LKSNSNKPSAANYADDHSATKPQPKRKPKTFETQRNRGSGGQKEETGKSELEEQKPKSTTRKSREGTGRAKKIFAAGKEFGE